MITLKKGTARWEMMGQIRPLLGKIVYNIVDWFDRNGVHDIVITSIIRPKTDDSGIHALGRAVDISIEELPGNLVFECIKVFNALYPYDSKYNTIVPHIGKGYKGDIGPHLHVQVK